MPELKRKLTEEEESSVKELARVLLSSVLEELSCWRIFRTQLNTGDKLTRWWIAKKE